MTTGRSGTGNDGVDGLGGDDLIRGPDNDNLSPG
jgi:hypothetical protein